MSKKTAKKTAAKKNNTVSAKDKAKAAAEKAKLAAQKAKEKEAEKAAKAKEKEEAKAKAKAEAEKLSAAHGLAVAKATDKGLAIANKAFGAEGLTENLKHALAKGVNENIVITPTGLHVKKGHEISELEITEAISGLCGINEETSKFRTTVTWAIGDAAVLADTFKGGSDRVVAQAISERGLSKHTVMQAATVCREFAPEDRIENVSFTHHQELRNYRKGVKNKKGYEKLIEELREQAKADEVMSCAELRERLQLLSGKKNDEGEGDNKEGKGSGAGKDGGDLFLYIDSEGIATFSRTFRKDICEREDIFTFDLKDMTALKQSGALYYSIKEVEPAEATEAEVVKDDDKKVEKDDKPKGKAKKSAQLPD